ncbi:hypothetical protein V2I01_23500 [Micromonospora sp. BRA006-A]|nr:hypothetical protein [Micromonospora sp. BRA006-A]
MTTARDRGWPPRSPTPGTGPTARSAAPSWSGSRRGRTPPAIRVPRCRRGSRWSRRTCTGASGGGRWSRSGGCGPRWTGTPGCWTPARTS